MFNIDYDTKYGVYCLGCDKFTFFESYEEVVEAAGQLCKECGSELQPFMMNKKPEEA